MEAKFERRIEEEVNQMNEHETELVTKVYEKVDKKEEEINKKIKVLENEKVI